MELSFSLPWQSQLVSTDLFMRAERLRELGAIKPGGEEAREFGRDFFFLPLFEWDSEDFGGVRRVLRIGSVHKV